MKRSITALLVPLLLGFAAPAADPARDGQHDYEVPHPGTYALPVIKTAAAGALLDAGGEATDLLDLTRGRVTVLSFIYTRCADATACPYATGVLMQLHEASRRDAGLAAGLRLVSLSFDPVHDTPERLRAYASLAGPPDEPAAEWRFVTAPSREALLPVLEAYGQAVSPRKNLSDPLGPLHHNLRVFLVDAAGRVRNIYSSGTLDARLILADVRTLLLEASEARGD